MTSYTTNEHGGLHWIPVSSRGRCAWYSTSMQCCTGLDTIHTSAWNEEGIIMWITMCRREDPGTRFGLNVPRIDALPRKLQDVSTERKTRSMKLFTGLALSLLLCTAVVSVVKADDDDLGSRAFVLVQKSVNTPEEIKHSEGTLKNVLVQSRNATVTITVNNVGGLVASDVQVEDSFEEELFEISGVTSAKYDKLLPGEQREFSYQIVPTWHTEDLRNVSQYYTQKAATVLYSYGEDEDLNERVSESSTEQIVPVFSNEDYLARTAMFAREWITFFLLSAGPVLGPLFYYTYVSNLIKEGQKRR